MSPRYKERRYGFESLESRTLLAGDVSAAVVDGDLIVQGDDLENIFTMVQIADPGGPGLPPGTAVAFEIIPDPTTSINGSDPGVGIIVSGITEDVEVHLGGGADELDIEGTPGPEIVNMMIRTDSGEDSVRIRNFGASGNLKIFNSSGSDSYSLTHSSVGRRLRFDGGRSGATADLSEVSIARTVDKSTPKLQQATVSGKNTDVKIHLMKSSGSTKLVYHKMDGKVAISESEIGGNLKVSSTDKLDFSMHNSSAAADVFLKIADIKGESSDGLSLVANSQITVSGSKVGEAMEVKAGGPLDFVMHKSQVGGNTYLKFGLKESLSSSFMASKSDFRGYLKVESAAPMENISLNFSKIKQNYTVQIDGGSSDGGVPMKYNIAGSKIGGKVVFEDRSARDPVPGGPTGKKAATLSSHGGPVSTIITISDSTISGQLQIQSGNGSEEILLDRIKVGGTTEIDTGAGDDLLEVIDSIFEGHALFDGGSGVDTLILVNNQFLDGEEFLNWE